MKLKRAFRLLTDNFSAVYKILLYRIVLDVLFLGLSYVVLNFGLSEILKSAEAREILDLIGEFFEALFTGRSAVLESFRETFLAAIAEFVGVLTVNIGSIVGSVIGVIVIYLLFRFLKGIGLFSMGSIFYDRMAFYGRTHFSAAYFKNLGKAMLYQVIYVPLSFLYDLLAVGACWLFFFYTPSFFASYNFATVVLGISVSVAVYVCMQALKMTLISGWIPAMVAGKSVGKSMKESLCNRKNAAGRFSSYLITAYLVLVLNFGCGLMSFGSMLLLTVPASYLLILWLQLVYYFEDHGIKYYLSAHEIFEGDPLVEREEIEEIARQAAQAHEEPETEESVPAARETQGERTEQSRDAEQDRP